MTSSGTNPSSLPPTETLNPTAPAEALNDSINGHDSLPPNDNYQVQNDTDTTNTSEKRKREEETDTAPQQQHHHPLYKTTLCSYFRRHGKSCSHGSACRYAHGEEELRIRPDNTWDPTSKRAKAELAVGEEEEEEEEESEDEIMMIDAVVGDGDGGCLDVELSKCLVHLPRRWGPDHFRKFLTDQVCV